MSASLQGPWTRLPLVSPAGEILSHLAAQVSAPSSSTPPGSPGLLISQGQASLQSGPGRPAGPPTTPQSLLLTPVTVKSAETQLPSLPHPRGDTPPPQAVPKAGALPTTKGVVITITALTSCPGEEREGFSYVNARCQGVEALSGSASSWTWRE